MTRYPRIIPRTQEAVGLQNEVGVGRLEEVVLVVRMDQAEAGKVGVTVLGLWTTAWQLVLLA